MALKTYKYDRVTGELYEVVDMGWAERIKKDRKDEVEKLNKTLLSAHLEDLFNRDSAFFEQVSARNLRIPLDIVRHESFDIETTEPKKSEPKMPSIQLDEYLDAIIEAKTSRRYMAQPLDVMDALEDKNTMPKTVGELLELLNGVSSDAPIVLHEGGRAMFGIKKDVYRGDKVIIHIIK